MLEIRVRFDHPGQVQASLDHGSTPVFGLWWRVEGVDFPEDGWADFAIMLLGWWTDNGSALANGVSIAEFGFMDGSGRILASREKRSETIRLRAVWNDRVTHEWTCHERDIVAALRPAVQQARAGLAQLTGADDVRFLCQLERQLRTDVQYPGV